MLADDTGKLLLVFQGRRRIPGIQPGARLLVEGMVGDWSRHQAILNPDYELIAGPGRRRAPELSRPSAPDRVTARSPDLALGAGSSVASGRIAGSARAHCGAPGVRHRP